MASSIEDLQCMIERIFSCGIVLESISINATKTTLMSAVERKELSTVDGFVQRVGITVGLFSLRTLYNIGVVIQWRYVMRF